jgi:hypothetical protein
LNGFDWEIRNILTKFVLATKIIKNEILFQNSTVDRPFRRYDRSGIRLYHPMGTNREICRQNAELYGRRHPGTGRLDERGNAAAFLGLFIHYFIALFFTWLFFFLLPRIKFLAYNKYLIGMLYAVFINVFMGQVAIRLSRLPSWGFNVPNAYIDWVIFGVIFGIPVAYNAYKYYGIG